jgi:hypothetical protein
MARAKLNKPPGLFTRVNWETAQAIKRLAGEMDISAAALINAILAKAMLNVGYGDAASTASELQEASSNHRDGPQL